MEQLIAGATTTPIDVDVNNFMSEVIDGSATTPTVVQFWAPWCGPCKQLGPVLEKVVAASNGKVRMVRVNIDENNEIAAQMRVQSVPTVYGFVEGKPVDGFSGAQPESAVRQFIDKLSIMGGAGADLAQVLEAGDAALAESDFAAAMTHFQQAMGIDPASVGSLAGVVRCLIGTGDLEGAAEIIEQLNDDYCNDPAMAQAIGALELAQKAAGSAGELDAARAAVNADAHDLDARQSLALALFAVGEHGEAMSHLLESIRIDKDWNEQAARLQLLEFFASLGAANPDVIASRRKLSTLLFS